jgi:archaeal flagellin FlaB
MAFDDSGEAGVGTMIIFIASVLVSAMLAGMFMQVANDFGQQAERTGNQAIHDISTGFDIVGVKGDRNVDSNESASSESTIQVITADAQLISGSAPIALADVTIQISDGNNVATLVFNETGTTAADADGTTFVTITVRDSDGSLDNGTITSGDIVKFVISTDTNATAMDIGPNTTITLDVVPAHGFGSTKKCTAPSVFTKRYVALS